MHIVSGVCLHHTICENNLLFTLLARTPWMFSNATIYALSKECSCSHEIIACSRALGGSEIECCTKKFFVKIKIHRFLNPTVAHHVRSKKHFRNNFLQNLPKMIKLKKKKKLPWELSNNTFNLKKSGTRRQILRIVWFFQHFLWSL